MATVKRDDRCKDCIHCSVWSSDSQKASCSMNKGEGFHPDRLVPAECIDQMTRKF
jgi:hypothetical protein